MLCEYITSTHMKHTTCRFLPAQGSSCGGQFLGPAHTLWAFLSQLAVLYHAQIRATFCMEHQDKETPHRSSTCPLCLALHPCYGTAEASSQVSAVDGVAWQLRDLKWNVWNWSLEVLKIWEAGLVSSNTFLIIQTHHLKLDYQWTSTKICFKGSQFTNILTIADTYCISMPLFHWSTHLQLVISVIFAL